MVPQPVYIKPIISIIAEYDKYNPGEFNVSSPVEGIVVILAGSPEANDLLSFIVPGKPGNTSVVTFSYDDTAPVSRRSVNIDWVLIGKNAWYSPQSRTYKVGYYTLDTQKGVFAHKNRKYAFVRRGMDIYIKIPHHVHGAASVAFSMLLFRVQYMLTPTRMKLFLNFLFHMETWDGETINSPFVTLFRHTNDCRVAHGVESTTVYYSIDLMSEKYKF